MADRTCMDCREDFPETAEFFPTSLPSGNLRRRCKPCWRTHRNSIVEPGAKRIAQAAYRERNRKEIAAKRRAYYAANRVVERARNREAQLKHMYGITIAQYHAILNSQGGLCAICRGESVDFFCVDHDHETNEIRGLLCRFCNSSLGRFGDNEAGVMRAVEYLRTARERIAAAIPEGPSGPVRKRADI